MFAPRISVISGGTQSVTAPTALAPAAFTIAGTDALQAAVVSSNSAFLPSSAIVLNPAARIGLIRSFTSRQILVGTGAAATWAVAFYQQYGFSVSPEQKTAPLKSWSTIPERQVAGGAAR